MHRYKVLTYYLNKQYADGMILHADNYNHIKQIVENIVKEEENVTQYTIEKIKLS